MKIQHLACFVLVFISTRETKSESERPAYLTKTSFPAQELFRVTDDETLLYNSGWGNYEFENFLKRRTCPGYHCARRCRCDNKCMQSQSCCIDYLWNNLKSEANITAPIPLKDYLSLIVKRASVYKVKVCQPAWQYTPGHSSKRIELVASCPKSASSAERENCLAIGPSNDINNPVIGSDGNVYKNQYCAMCNSIGVYNHLDISIECKSAGNLTDPGKSFSNFRGCLFRPITPAGQNIKECSDIFDRKCDPSHPYYDLCRSYFGPIGQYANVHCLWCNNETFSVTENHRCTDTSTGREVRSYSFVISFSDGTEYSYRNMFGPRFIDENGNVVEQAGKNQLCPAGETYELSQAKCVKFQCAVGYEVSNYTCVKVRIEGKAVFVRTNSSFDNCLLHSNARLLLDVGQRNVSSDLLHNLTLHIFPAQNNSSDDIELTSMQASDRFIKASSPLNTTTFQFVLLDLSSPQNPVWQNVDVIYISSQNIQYFSAVYGADLSRHFRRGICVERYALSESNVTYNTSCALSDFNASFSLDNVTLWVEIRPGFVSKKTYTCTKFHLQSSCKLRTIPPSNYTVSNTSSSVHLHDGTNKTLNFSQYVPLSDGVGVCTYSGVHSRVYVPTWLEDTDRAEYYITMIGIPISMVCYLWIILTYTLIRELRNIAGCNIAGLCSALLFSDIVFLIIVEMRQSNTSCKVFAIIFHWLLLQVQAWTAIVAVEICRRFTSNVRRSGESWTRFAVYVGAAMTYSTLIVAIMVAVDETKGYVEYGKGQLCWIYDFYSRLFGYTFLLGVVTLTASVLLGYVLFIIYKEHKDAKKFLNKSGGQPVNVTRIALKLVLLVGLVEMVGLVQITSPKTETEHAVNATFRILYTFLRSFRGVLIWIMYIATKVVWGHYKSRFVEESTVASKSTHMLQSSANNSLTELHKISTVHIPENGETKTEL